MGLTLVEKIISEHAGKQVHAGELVISKVDVSAVQDGTGPLTVQEFKKLGKSKLNNPDRTILFIDHATNRFVADEELAKHNLPPIDVDKMIECPEEETSQKEGEV